MRGGTVYLAGPIGSLTFDDANDWREVAEQFFAEYDGIDVLSPLRGKHVLRDHGILSTVGYDHLGPRFSDRGITTRDRNDVQTADVVLVNFLGTKKASLGTVMEIAWADSMRIPVVVAMETEGNVHDHAMIRECIGFRHASLEEALETVVLVLGGIP